MKQTRQKRIDEIKQLLVDQDLDLAGRKLLDFLTDFPVEQNLIVAGVHLREYYNLFSQKIETSPSEKKQWILDSFSFLELLEKSVGILGLQEDNSDLIASAPLLENQQQKKLVFRGTNLSKAYPSVRFLLSTLSLELYQGELTGLVGRNGNGKTTLLRIIAGELAIDKGEIAYPALQTEKKLNWYNLKQQIAFIPQHLSAWRGLLKDTLHFTAANHGLFGKENKQRVDFVIHRLGLSNYQEASWNEISSGYKLRFELAKALVWQPKLLVLDEPLANLDINTKLLFMQDLKLLATSQKYPMAVVMSSQQLHEIESVVDNIIFLKEGQALYNGKVAALGEDRATNTFELSGNFGRNELNFLLQNMGIIRIEDTGQSLLIEVPRHVASAEVLAKLKDKELLYFRDISRSTRKFFNN